MFFLIFLVVFELLLIFWNILIFSLRFVIMCTFCTRSIEIYLYLFDSVCWCICNSLSILWCVWVILGVWFFDIWCGDWVGWWWFLMGCVICVWVWCCEGVWWWFNVLLLVLCVWMKSVVYYLWLLVMCFCW